jgi:hypothetical protein
VRALLLVGLCGCSGAAPLLVQDADDRPVEPLLPALVRLNEVLAAHEAAETDEVEAADWVELYNAGEVDAPLGGWTIGTEQGELRFGEGERLAPWSYLLVWCDEAPEAGPLHAPFALSKEGQRVVLRDADGQLRDEVSWEEEGSAPFGVQEDEVSLARVPDGGELWGQLDPPTPSAPNR